MAFTRWPRVPAVRHRSGGHHHLVQRIGSEAEHAGALRFPDTAVPDLGDPVGRGGGAEHDGDVRRQPGARLQRRESSGPGRNRRQHTQALRHVMTRGNTLLLLLSAGLLSTASAQTVDSSYFNLLEWRLAGPTRGGRVLAVAGDPHDPQLVYVAALGDAWGPSVDRGVYRSKDGGRTWEKILYRDENTGGIDLAMDPSNPRIMYASLLELRRYPWGFRSAGPGTGLFKSTDGGD